MLRPHFAAKQTQVHRAAHLPWDEMLRFVWWFWIDFPAILLCCDSTQFSASRCGISGDSRPAILGIVRFAIRDSVPLRCARWRLRGRHGGVEKRGGWKTSLRTPLPKEKGVLDTPSYGTFSTPLRCPEALLEGSKNSWESAFSGTFSSPDTFCTPPHHGPNAIDACWCDSMVKPLRSRPGKPNQRKVSLWSRSLLARVSLGVYDGVSLKTWVSALRSLQKVFRECPVWSTSPERQCERTPPPPGHSVTHAVSQGNFVRVRSRPGKPNQRKADSHKTPQLRELRRFLWILIVFPGKPVRIHKSTPNSRTGLRIGLSLVWFAGAIPDRLRHNDL